MQYAQGRLFRCRWLLLAGLLLLLAIVLFSSRSFYYWQVQITAQLHTHIQHIATKRCHGKSMQHKKHTRSPVKQTPKIVCENKKELNTENLANACAFCPKLVGHLK